MQLRVADQEGGRRMGKGRMLVGISMLSQTVRERDAEWTAPAPQASRTNPLAGRTGVEAGGNRLFHERCSACHGEEARGTDRGPSLTTPRVQSQSDGSLFWKISSGNTRTGMPTFIFLSELQRVLLVMH